MSTPQNLHESLHQTRQYITALEGAIVAICEAEEVDPADLLEGIETLDEGMLKRIAGAVRNTTQRVRNAASKRGFRTDAQLNSDRQRQRERWAREDAAKKAAREREALADRKAAERERERQISARRAPSRSTKEYSSEPWAGRVDEGLINNIGKTIDTIHRVKRRMDQVRDVAREVKAGYDRMRGGSAKPKPASTRTRGGVAWRIGSTVARAMGAARAARDSWARSTPRTA